MSFIPPPPSELRSTRSTTSGRQIARLPLGPPSSHALGSQKPMSYYGGSVASRQTPTHVSKQSQTPFDKEIGSSNCVSQSPSGGVPQMTISAGWENSINRNGKPRQRVCIQGSSNNTPTGELAAAMSEVAKTPIPYAGIKGKTHNINSGGSSHASGSRASGSRYSGSRAPGSKASGSQVSAGTSSWVKDQQHRGNSAPESSKLLSIKELVATDAQSGVSGSTLKPRDSITNASRQKPPPPPRSTHSKAPSQTSGRAPSSRHTSKPKTVVSEANE